MKTEIMPLYSNVILLPYEQNPYANLLTESGLQLTNGEFDNTDSGEHDRLELYISCAKVVEVGPKGEYVQAGDDVFFDTRSARPVPFMRQGFFITAEQNLICVMNDDLKERFKKD